MINNRIELINIGMKIINIKIKCINYVLRKGGRAASGRPRTLLGYYRIFLMLMSIIFICMLIHCFFDY